MFEIEIFTIIGIAAAICTTISFLPQAIRIIRTKQTRDVSLGMYVLFSFGTFLWLAYGILLKDVPIILANSITFVLSFIILAMKLKYK